MKLYRLCFTPSGYYTVSNYRVIESLLEVSIWNPRSVKKFRNLRKIIKLIILTFSFYIFHILNSWFNYCWKFQSLENPFEFIWNPKSSFRIWKFNLNLKSLYPVWKYISNLDPEEWCHVCKFKFIMW